MFCTSFHDAMGRMGRMGRIGRINRVTVVVVRKPRRVAARVWGRISIYYCCTYALPELQVTDVQTNHRTEMVSA